MKVTNNILVALRVLAGLLMVGAVITPQISKNNYNLLAGLMVLLAVILAGFTFIVDYYNEKEGSNE